MEAEAINIVSVEVTTNFRCLLLLTRLVMFACHFYLSYDIGAVS